jgi:hypothetical protein
MTLAEKFHQWLKTEPFSSKERPTLKEAQCVKIADEYAIEFAKWIINHRVEFFDDTSSGEIYTYMQYHIKYSMIELLKIFKQEIENL